MNGTRQVQWTIDARSFTEGVFNERCVQDGSLSYVRYEDWNALKGALKTARFANGSIAAFHSYTSGHAECILSFQDLPGFAFLVQTIEQHPTAVQLRYMQTLSEIGAEQNTVIVFPLPMELLK